MKLSFSTRGWPELSWDDMIQTALDMGFSGIEVYNLSKFPALTEKDGPFHKYKTAATVRQMREKHLSIPCLDTSIDLTEDPTDVEQLLQAAHNAHVPYVVVCALSECEDRVFANLSKLLPRAEALDVSLLIKTSGIYHIRGGKATKEKYAKLR